MRKKLLALLLVGAVAATSIIGFTACNDSDNESEENGVQNGVEDDDLVTIAKGVQVDAEGWAKAFEASLAAENFTEKAYAETTNKTQGTDKDYGEIDFSLTETRSGTGYYDGSNAQYSATKVKTVATGVPDDEELQNKYKDKEYGFEDYIVKDGETYYHAYYSNEKEDDEWSVSTFDTMFGSKIDVLNVEFATEKKGELVDLVELYEAFTYEDGVYSAALWQNDVEATVSVSVKDGYVVGYSTDVFIELTDEDGKESEHVKLVFNFSDYGSTTVTPSDAAKKVVEDYKAANALQKGEQVTKEQWKAAIAATVAAENFTAITDYEETKSGVKTDDATVTYTKTQNTKAKYYVDLGGKEFYLDGTTGAKITGGEAIGEEDADVTIPFYLYYTLEGTTRWGSTYNWEDNSEPNKWEAWCSDYDTEEEAKAGLANMADINTSINLTISETAGGAQVSLLNAYSLFTYEDGFYTASVYYRGEIVDLSLSFGKGYCTGIKMESTKETTNNGFNVTVSTRDEYTFSAFGTTAVDEPEGAIAAIEAAKPPVSNSVVAGKTFVFDSVKFEYDNSVSEYDKKQYENAKPQLEAMNTGYTIVFDNDWGCTMPKEKVAGTYTEDGNVITFTRVSVDGDPAPSEPILFILSGNKLTISDTQNGVTLKMIYIVQA